MDVQNGSGYPVFDVIQGRRAPTARSPIPIRPPIPTPAARRRTCGRSTTDGVLVGHGGHLHPGWAARRPVAAIATGVPRAALFHSDAQVLRARRRGVVGRGDDRRPNPTGAVRGARRRQSCRVSTTYDSGRASWYESMGIMVVWMADVSAGGTDPFVTAGRRPGHAHPRAPARERQPRRRPADGSTATSPRLPSRAPAGPIHIADFVYAPGRHVARRPRCPRSRPGSELTFSNDDAPVGNGIWHSITACKAPCNLRDRHRLSPRRRRHPVRLRPARRRRPADRGSHRLDDAHRPPRRHLHLLLPHPPVMRGGFVVTED